MSHRLSIALIAVVLLVPVIALGGLAVAASGDDGTIADGVSIQGIAVGGLSPEAATRKVDASLAAATTEPIRVKIRGGVFKLDPKKAGVTVDVPAAVAKAESAGDDGSFISRGWRKVSGGEVDEAIGLKLAANRTAVVEFVKDIERKMSRKPVDAQLSIKVDRVSVTGSRPGRRLAAQDQLKRQINAALVQPGSPRTFTAKLRRVKSKVTTEQVWKKNPTVVTVSKSGAIVRVFKRGRMVKSYGVSVGSDQYPTSEGQFVVQSKQVNPTWSVPNSSWAGGLAGKVIPGGAANNPLKARWIGFNGSEGFHGSTSVGGAARSHGCVRMVPAQVIDLFERVEVGTPVLIAA